MDFKIYFILFFVYSFLGWLIEVIWTYICDRKLVDRGFLVGPICPIYGFGCILIIILLKKYIETPIALFIMSMVICSILEYFTSYIMEKVFNARWWDYSKRKYNINGRVCLETMIPFGILATIIMYLLNPLFVNTLEKIPQTLLLATSIILGVIFTIDFCVSFKVILNFRSTVKSARDNTEEITKYVKETLRNKSRLNKRLVTGFPNFTVRIKQIITDISEDIGIIDQKEEKKDKSK